VQQEKVLVFSHSIKLLSVVESLLERYPINGEIYRYNEDYFRLDGSKSSKSRQTDIDSFNHAHNTAARLYLVSTRAGSLGVNLVAANRVVLMDVSFNPTYDLQAIFRTYRLVQIAMIHDELHP